MKIIVAGTGMRGSGYPNAENTIRILRETAGWQVEDRAHWMPEGMPLWKSANGSRFGLVRALAGLVLTNLGAALKLVMSRDFKKHWTYAPYPAVFLLWWLSWVPQSLRPRVVADAYISLWDSAFRDRAMAVADGIPARAAKWFEGRALRAAAMVFVDTVANKDWMSREFRIRPERIHAIPLAIDDRVFGGAESCREHAPDGALQVLYLGTLVPLHGIGVIVDAVAELAECRDFFFQFVGDGQQSGLLERVQHEYGVAWHRQWLLEEQVARLLAKADISLGVFGGSGKASRVLPFKVYLSLAAGTPVLTQQGYSLPEDVPAPPVFTVSPGANDLAEKLLELGGDRHGLLQASRDSRDYYRAHLGPVAIAQAWLRWLDVPASG